MHEPNAPVATGLLQPIFAALVAACAAAPQVGYTQSTTAQRPEVIVVTSSRIEQPRRQIGTAVSVIDFDDIELRGYVDLADVLRTQTGIAVTNTGGRRQSHVGAYPRRGELSHFADDRRRQNARPERAASLAELR